MSGFPCDVAVLEGVGGFADSLVEWVSSDPGVVGGWWRVVARRAREQSLAVCVQFMSGSAGNRRPKRSTRPGTLGGSIFERVALAEAAEDRGVCLRYAAEVDELHRQVRQAPSARRDTTHEQQHQPLLEGKPPTLETVDLGAKSIHPQNRIEPQVYPGVS